MRVVRILRQVAGAAPGLYRQRPLETERRRGMDDGAGGARGARLYLPVSLPRPLAELHSRVPAVKRRYYRNGARGVDGFAG